MVPSCRIRVMKSCSTGDDVRCLALSLKVFKLLSCYWICALPVGPVVLPIVLWKTAVVKGYR